MLQKAFEFYEVPSYEIENFIVTSSNKLIFDKINNWPLSWDYNNYPYSLLINGPKKSGKSHLANIWRHKANASIFASHQSIETLDGRCNIVVEDIDSPNWTQQDLLYIFNFCHQTQRYCLFTNSSWPIAFSLSDLSSRIKSIDRLDLNPPDMESIKIILRKEFCKKSLQVEQKVIDLLTEILPTNFDAAISAVHNLNKVSLDCGKPINSAMIKKLFLQNI
jgi:chromosomal replication initiation ATPase DnaA